MRLFPWSFKEGAKLEVREVGGEKK